MYTDPASLKVLYENPSPRKPGHRRGGPRDRVSCRTSIIYATALDDLSTFEIRGVFPKSVAIEI